MKNIYCFLIFLFPFVISAQNDSLKHDYIWLAGYASNPTQLEFGGTVIDFNIDTVETYYEYRDFDFSVSNTTMCNQEGELIFSCNNKIIANRLNEVMENGSGLNPDPTAFQDRVRQAVLALPYPNSDSLYIVLHQESTFLSPPLDGNIIGIFSLKKTVVDINWSDNPNISDLGQVIEKNTPIIQDTLTFGRLTATRHANGRDWWILQQEYGSNKFYRFLLNPEGIIEEEVQYEGENQLYETSGVGQAVFSPDGTKYVLINSWSTAFPPHIDFFNFNRCDGLLSDFERIELDAEERLRGVVISPNSKYAYLTTSKNYYQIDLEQSPKILTLIEEVDISLSQSHVGQLAPNGKIYFVSGNAIRNMHIIHNPNEAGVACNVEQNGLYRPEIA